MESMENEIGMSGPSRPSCEAATEHETSEELEARLTRLSEQLAGKPFKQIIPLLREGKHPATVWIVESYDRFLKRERKAREKAQKERKEEEKATKQAAPGAAIEAERRRRLSMLERATKYRRGDKLLEQLVGREKDFSLFWAAGKLVSIEVHPRVPTDKEIAAAFATLSGKPCSKDQARGRRKVVEKLNAHDGVWRLLEAG